MKILKKIRTNSTTTSPVEDGLKDANKEEVFEPSFAGTDLNKELLEMNNYKELDRLIEAYENETGERADRHYKQLLNVVCSEEVSAEALNQILQRLYAVGDKKLGYLVREAFRFNGDIISDETVQGLIYQFHSYHGFYCSISDFLSCPNISLYTVKKIFDTATGLRAGTETEQRILLDYVASKFLSEEEYESSKTLTTKKLAKLVAQKIFEDDNNVALKVLNQITGLGIQQSPAYINNNHYHLFVWKTYINNNVSDVRLIVKNETKADLSYYLKGSNSYKLIKTKDIALTDALQALTKIFK